MDKSDGNKWNGPHFKLASGGMRPLTSESDGRKRVRTIASSSIEDRSGDKVSRSALERMSATAKGLTVFRNHTYKVPDDVFGYIEDAHVEQTSKLDDEGLPIWDLVTDIVVSKDEKSEATYSMIEDGLKLGVSIGAKIPKGAAKKNPSGGYTFESLELMEASIVGIPDNPRAYVLNAVKAVKMYGLDEDEDDEPNTGFFSVASDSFSSGTSTYNHSSATTSTVGTATTEATHDGKESTVSEVNLTKSDEELLAGLEIDFEAEGDQAAADALYAELDKDADPDLVKAPLSSETRNNLPDSAFACPEKRKYPIQDKAHIRNALSRCGDPTNDQCGCDRVRAAARKAGIGEEAKSSEPELVKEAAVVAASPVEEPPAQELDSVPESAGTAVDDGTTDTIRRSADLLADLVKSQTTEIVNLRKAREETAAERDALKAELAETKANLVLAKEIVEKIAKTPFGRKGVVAEKVTEFESLESKFGGIYSPDVLKSLEK